jgi:hypothetical protein
MYSIIRAGTRTTSHRDCCSYTDQELAYAIMSTLPYLWQNKKFEVDDVDLELSTCFDGTNKTYWNMRTNVSTGDGCYELEAGKNGIVHQNI